MARLIAYCLLLLALLLPAAAVADQDISIQFDNKKRTAWLALPDRFDSSKIYPTVIVLHGGGSTGDQMRSLTGFEGMGDKESFIAVFPNGTPGLGSSFMTWNAGDCCGKAKQRDVDDVQFLDVLIDTLIRQYNADPKRIYMTGHSNGAMMAYRYACVHPERLAAIAPNAGQEWYRNCTETERPVPILHLHGTADQCANYGGGEKCGGCFADIAGMSDSNAVRACYAVPDTIKAWAQRYACKPQPISYAPQGAMVCEDWTGCKGGSSIRFCRLEGAGHNWPGYDNQTAVCRTAPKSNMCRKYQKVVGEINRDIDATRFIWDYFKTQKQP